MEVVQGLQDHDQRRADIFSARESRLAGASDLSLSLSLFPPSHLAVVSLTAPTIGPSRYGVGRPEDAGSRSKKLQLSMLTASLAAMVVVAADVLSLLFQKMRN